MKPFDDSAGAVVVRHLRPSDLEAVIALDARSVGRRRDEFFARAFFRREGFVIAQRLCLDLDLHAARDRADRQ